MKQYKAVILGSENYHAIGLAKDLLSGYLPNVELMGMYGTDEASNQAMREMGVAFVTDNPLAFSDQANLILITSRHGDTHLPLARPYMKRGNIIWIDKPLAIRPEDFEALHREAKEQGCLLWGSSFLPKAESFAPLKQAMACPGDLGAFCGGMIASPVRREEEFGGFFFYTQHLVEIAIGIFGKDIKSVFASEGENGYSVILRYSGFDISGIYREGSFHYDACACFEKGTLHGHVTPEDVAIMHRAVLEEIDYAMREGKSPLTPEEMALPFHILHKMHQSLQTKSFQEI